jgi:GNAT superfamily N-acetyltransferase
MNLKKTKEKYENKIIKTSKNIPLRLKIEQSFDGGSNRWEYFNIEATHADNEERVGFLKLAVLSQDNFEKYFGDILKFADSSKGMRLNVADAPEVDKAYFKRRGMNINKKKNDPKTQDGKKEIIKALTWNGGELIKTLNTEEAVNKQFKKSVDALKRKIGDSYKMFIDYHLEKPEVHYVSVEDNYKRKGVASTLYDVAVDLVNENGYKLFQSTTQTPEAEALWASKSNVVRKEGEKRAVMIKNDVPKNKSRKRLKP